MPIPSEESIRQAAEKFRWALDRVSSETWAAATITNFPQGACGHCAELMAQYLADQFGVSATYVNADVSAHVCGLYHTWLEYDGLVIDISADQFGLQPVIVGKGLELHRTVSELDKHPIIRDHWWSQYAAAVYAEAMSLLRDADNSQDD